MQKSSFQRLAPWLLTVIVVGVVLVGVNAFGQDPAAAADAEPPKKTLWSMAVAGGWAMYPLALFSVAMITLAVYNFMQLTKGKFAPPELKHAILSNMAEVRVRSAIEHSAASPSYLGRMMANALPFVDATEPESLGREKVENAMADFASKENPAYMTWVGYFSTIAAAAPMVGLLGTVSGMIKAFDALNTSKGADPGKMASAISEALITTAAGLIVAIPCLFFFVFFKNKLNAMVADVQRTAEEGLSAAIATVNADQQLAKVPEGIAEG